MQVSSHVDICIPADGRKLQGELTVPRNASGIVAFAHGSGSNRHSPRNQFVARELQRAGVATLLLDLLEEEETADPDKVIDLGMLAERLLAATRWIGDNPATASLVRGYFGASTGAAVALVAAACNTDDVSAVVSRSGRPDLAKHWLPQVKAPTLLIVGGNDAPVLQWNRDAYRCLSVEKELIVVPNATHLFEEPGTLEEVARHACRWFVRHLAAKAIGDA
ncbi:Hydrolase [Georgfuchsia toluolica]|uniref:Hydrolase n=1 Tax=Georgfuchsia toluolica TaxID=424218 RepID=A0A916J6M5_9PROT|nr:dienelactone hydrolase family protein [Georgfuchsia toluolica]CAG4884413.1 Hydrolase [Georgfuchsia toluolica]